MCVGQLVSLVHRSSDQRNCTGVAVPEKLLADAIKRLEVWGGS